MKKRITTLFVFLLIACLMLTACSTGESFEPDVEPAEELEVDPDFVEMNCYDIGDGISIRLNTRIEDYITPDKIFRFYDLAEDLGWHEIVYSKTGNIDHSLVRMFDAEPNPVFFQFCDVNYLASTRYMYFGTIEEIDYYPFSVKEEYFITNENPEYLSGGLSWNNIPDNVYYLNDRQTTLIYFSQIVLCAYVMENYRGDEDLSFLDEILERVGNTTWSIYE